MRKFGTLAGIVRKTAITKKYLSKAKYFFAIHNLNISKSISYDVFLIYFDKYILFLDYYLLFFNK